MAASKKNFPKRKENPKSREIGSKQDPNSYYHMYPSWRFNICDEEKWAFNEDHAGAYFWNNILPNLKNWEKMTWQDILVTNKKSNHSIDLQSLNPSAQRRFEEFCIEAESIISLRIQGTYRIYGYIGESSSFCILWFDDNHGDNDECVCRSYKKHT